MRAGGKAVKVKACGHGDDLRCVGASRAEAQECVNIGSAVFHFFGLEASPKKMWVRRLMFDQEGLLVEVGEEERVGSMNWESGERVELKVWGGEEWCKHLGEKGNLMGDTKEECDRVRREGQRVGRMVDKAQLYGTAKLGILDTVWGAMGRHALKHLAVGEQQLRGVERGVVASRKRALRMGVSMDGAMVEGSVESCMVGKLGFTSGVMIEKAMVLVRVLGSEGGGLLRKVCDVWVSRIQESTGKREGVLMGMQTMAAPTETRGWGRWCSGWAKWALVLRGWRGSQGGVRGM